MERGKKNERLMPPKIRMPVRGGQTSSGAIQLTQRLKLKNVSSSDRH